MRAGTVQLVWAMAPPDDVPCFSRSLRDVMVTPSVGKHHLIPLTSWLRVLTGRDQANARLPRC